MLVGVLGVVGALVSAYSADSASDPSCKQDLNFSFHQFTKNKPFKLNTLCTTPYDNPNTPAWADILVAPQNFVACKGATIALCYYSGPVTPADPSADPPTPPTPCYLRDGEDIADCTCFEIPAGSTYYVDINAILNLDVYLDTVNKCGITGKQCLPFGSQEAPVCEAIRTGKLIPGADLISTFSFALEREIPIVQGNCTEANPPNLYAGCMTAPCKRIPGEYYPNAPYPLVQCACPTYRGPFQVGRQITAEDPCDLPDKDNTVWSAAFTDIDTSIPHTPTCFPDRPVDEGGCPLLPAGFKEGDVPVPANVSCQKVCSEYRQSSQNGIEVGFTCDATLCTDPSNRALSAKACKGLGENSTSEILKLEFEAGYSCAASQICGCEPNKKTNQEIWSLNQVQEEVDGVETQCQFNGTLCGTMPR